MTYLKPTYYLDYQSKTIQDLISEFKDKSITPKERTIGIYTKIRDQYKYNPYSIKLAKENYRASAIAKQATGNCVEKSIVLIACLRALGIPARLHLGKVKNHMAADRLIEKFGSNELTPHGMVNAYINHKWLKMSPAFNKTLCTKFNVAPLEFDGENSSFLQQYNSKGTLFMEYVEDYGHFEDIPLEFMKRNLKDHYPHIFNIDKNTSELKF